MELSGNHFEYNGISSRRYGLVFAHVDTSRIVTMRGESEPSVIYHKSAGKNYIIGEDYTDSPISFEAEIVTDYDNGIPRQERRNIEKWLFTARDYKKLYVDSMDDFEDTLEYVDGAKKRLYLNCVFRNPEKLENGSGMVIGYKFTVECDSAMAWQDAVTKTYTVTDGSTITVNVDTDMPDYIYPTVSIQMDATGGDLSIVNNSDRATRRTSFVGLAPNQEFEMNGRINYVSNNLYDAFSARNFVRLLDGENSITITGNIASISFTFQNRRFL